MIGAKYLQIPYKDLGRDEKGCDCYGLVYIMMKDLLGINLPIYTSYESNNSPKLGNFINVQSADSDLWEKVVKPRAGDLVVFKLNGIPQHVGYMLSGLEFMEMTRDAGVTVGRVTDSRSRHLIAYYCRYIGE